MQKSPASTQVKIAAVLFLLALVASTVYAVDITLSTVAPSGVNDSDAALGWRLKKNLSYHRDKYALSGRKFNVSFATNENGFRTFGVRKDAPVRVLVLGDSHTGEPYASNDQMWYGEFVRRLAALTNRPASDFYVMAGASGGYGTLQSLLLAREVSRSYSPTLLVHQFCDNDFMNNSYELEQKSVVLNQWLLRPYLSQDRKGVVFHEGVLAQLYRAFLYRSSLFALFDRALQVSLSQYYGGYLMLPRGNEEAFLKQVRAITYDENAISITQFLLQKLRELHSAIPAVMVDCPIEDSSQNDKWVNVGKKSGFITITAPSDYLVDAKRRGESDLFNADGGHLSDKGNEVMGRILADSVAPLGLIEGKSN